MKEIKNVLIIAVCIVIAIFGLYFQFFAKEEKAQTPEKKAAESERDRKQEVFEGTDGQSPAAEEELEQQTFGDDDTYQVYFSGMQSIQEDPDFLPMQAYADMVQVTTDFLKDQEEVEIPAGKVELRLSDGMTYKSNNLISFHCYFAGSEIDQELEFVYDNLQMKYIDIHFTEKGEWDILWKR